MKKIFFVFLSFLAVIFLSCNNQSDKPSQQNSDSSSTALYEYQPNDKQVVYYDNGQAQYMQEYLNGIKHGEYKDWFKDGKIRTVGFYKMGMRNGVWNWYDERGIVTLQVKYEKSLAQL